ncbi:MAG: hypothetical protein M5R36_25065 [Deltaproteobacteria bacterium]|nr:hypothetical protein [Deltaproteobacteria bacterium]
MLNLIDFGGPRDQFDALIGEDGWHPNAAGNRVLGERIGAVLLQDQQRRASKPAGTNTAPQ